MLLTNALVAYVTCLRVIYLVNAATLRPNAHFIHPHGNAMTPLDHLHNYIYIYVDFETGHI